ncbi:MAG: 50S ribosomal protein L15 [bacterium]
MSLNLNTLKAGKGIAKARKRVGRGNASGHGTYSCRGLKGQKSRSGVSGLKRLGMKQMLLSTPKKRGFKSRYPDNQVVNLEQINEKFKQAQTVSPASLRKAGLIAKIKLPVKILGKGELKISELIFANVLISKSAEEQIKKNNGVIKI